MIFSFRQQSFLRKLLILFVLILMLGSCSSLDNSEQTDDQYFDIDEQYLDDQYLSVDNQHAGNETENIELAQEPVVLDGFVRLILNEKAGSFSLSYVPNTSYSIYEPLFISRDPRSSYMSVLVNGKIHRLGYSRVFSTSITRQNGNPALVFESPFMTVVQEFTPVKTGNSLNANGIKITINILNTSEEDLSVGLKFLLDTELGEKRGMMPFVTQNQSITSETILSGSSGERYWMSRGDIVSLMGSIVNPVDENAIAPDFIHFANWKRLDEAMWKLRYMNGRSFSNFPYSMNDSAVCYFYEPAKILSGGDLTYTIFLTTEDAEWYYPPERSVYIISESAIRKIDISTLQEAAFLDALHNNENPQWLTLKRIQEILNQFVDGDVHLDEKDMADIERIINQHRN